MGVAPEYEPLTPTATPIARHERIAIVDILRGWALLAVVLVNYSIFYSFQANVRVPADDVLSRMLKGIVQVFFQGKGWPLLALLFGYGFSVALANITAKGLGPFAFFGRRMLWLLVIGVVNCALYYGDVLKDYAVVGLIIMTCHRVSGKQALYLSAVCFFSFPALIAWSKGLPYQNPVSSPDLALYLSQNPVDVLWFGLKFGAHVSLSVSKLCDWNLVMLTCAFAGMCAHRLNVFGNLEAKTQQVKRVLWLSLAFTVTSAAVRKVGARWDLDSCYEIDMWFFLGQMVFFAAGICWVYATGRLTPVFGALQVVGRMTLTNYVTQNVIALIAFSGAGFGLLHGMRYSQHIALALAVFAAQIWFSTWWLSRYRHGPVEWLWRTLCYRHALRLRE